MQGHRALFDFCTLSGLRYEVCRSPDKASPDIRKETFKTSDLDRTLVQNLVDAGFYFDGKIYSTQYASEIRSFILPHFEQSLFFKHIPILCK